MPTPGSTDLNIIPSILRPGGMAEFMDIDWWPRSQNPAPKGSRYLEWARETMNATLEMGKPIIGVIDAILHARDAAGLLRTGHRSEELHTDPDRFGCGQFELRKRLARRHNSLLCEPQLGYLESLALPLLTGKGWTAAEVRMLCRTARKELGDYEGGFQPYHLMLVCCVLPDFACDGSKADRCDRHQITARKPLH